MSEDPLSQWTNDKLADYVNATRWANAEIERLRKQVKEQAVFLNGAGAEIERLKTVISGRDLNDKALKEKACLAALEASCDAQHWKIFVAILSNLKQTKEREREAAKR